MEPNPILPYSHFHQETARSRERRQTIWELPIYLVRIRFSIPYSSLLSDMHNSQFEFQLGLVIIDRIASSSNSVQLLDGMTIEIKGLIVEFALPFQSKVLHKYCQPFLNWTPVLPNPGTCLFYLGYEYFPRSYQVYPLAGQHKDHALKQDQRSLYSLKTPLRLRFHLKQQYVIRRLNIRQILLENSLFSSD